jgi:hypothetical protein
MIAPPLPPGQLFKRADLAGHARVLSVADLRLRAHLRFTKLLKGRPPQTGFLGMFGLSRDVTVKIQGRKRFPKLGAGITSAPTFQASASKAFCFGTPAKALTRPFGTMLSIGFDRDPTVPTRD